MSDFHTEDKHSTLFALLFDSCNIEEKFKERTEGSIPYVILKDKEEKRISAMLHSAGEIGAHFIKLQTSAVSAIAMARSEEEAIAMTLGLIKLTANGICICKSCLDKAIQTCEENLAILKDIKEATDQYAPKC
jgi:hypothetical protein